MKATFERKSYIWTKDNRIFVDGFSEVVFELQSWGEDLLINGKVISKEEFFKKLRKTILLLLEKEEKGEV